ncbi:NB-ARC domain-containing protein [Dictyobacter arantiisoli]|uniref:Orc1-like AAA ATPase domain-containing protein n=1 Tax=Dictyobacter arantiisoli TaxID=2014874 RepID=A0A5A5TL03_9CHLR|nr:NB-ARC domain-containing protein [Dictyobacter arantiisoli]GCF11995.1 hypothetical protein KDI_55590 [Dictyobacter arantiisoli]
MKTSMDAIRFGKWISEQRRKQGWSSQRTLIEAVHEDPLLKDTHLSEDFLARLEAGRLTYPFRGHVRQQVLALAWLLCRTSREVQAYLQAASLRELRPSENAIVQALYEHVSSEPVSTVMMLPARPPRLLGRDALVQTVLQQICTTERGLCALTGMPGVGKSALAAEIVHQLATSGSRRVFQDGIITLSCTGRRGALGLITLLNEIIDIFSQSSSDSQSEPHAARKRGQFNHHASHLFLLEHMETDLAAAVDRVRMLLLDKHVLFVLDDLDPQFPLHEALDALSGSTQFMAAGAQGRYRSNAQRVVLTTSRHVPLPSLMNHHLLIPSLSQVDACELFANLTASQLKFQPEDRESWRLVEQICTLVGGLPLAVELIAQAATVKGIPLLLLAATVAHNPFHPLLDENGKLTRLFEEAFQPIEAAQREAFSLLALLGPQEFSLETATVLALQDNIDTLSLKRSPAHALFASSNTTDRSFLATSPPFHLPFEQNYEAETISAEMRQTSLLPVSILTHTALVLGQFVNYSLLQLIDRQQAGGSGTTSLNHQSFYRLHPLLYMYARNRLQDISSARLTQVRNNLHTYAQTKRGE